MKRATTVVFFLALLIGVAGLGCGGSNTPIPATPEQVAAQHEADVTNRAKLIRTAASGAASIGLNEWAKKEPDAAKEAATALTKNIKTVLTPYFANTAALPSSAEVQAFLSSSLMAGVNPTLKTAIITASTTLDLALPVPSADKMDPDAVKYIQAFLSGLSDACDNFLGTSKDVAKPTTWIK